MLERFLYQDADERERLVALALRLRTTYAAALALMVVSVGFGIPVFGAVAAIPLVVAIAIHLVLAPGLPRARRPERRIVASAAAGIVATLACIWLADGPKEYLFAAPAIPMLGLAGVSTRRASIAAAVLTCLGLVLVGLGSYGDQVRAMPPIVILPMVLIIVTVLGSMASRSAEDVDRDTAVVDPLTGLLNRGALQARSAELQLHAEASADRVGMIVADIDDFSRVNEARGRAAGDAILVEVASRLRAEVGNAGAVFRFGGEEFVVLLQSASLGTAVEWAKRLREALCFAPIDGVDITASFGVAVSDPEAGFEYRSLYAQADAALYRAKTSGRDRVCSADDTHRSFAPVMPDHARPAVRRATDVEPAAAAQMPPGDAGSWDAHLRSDGDGNWLVADSLERAHAVDLLGRSARASTVNSVITLIGLVASAFWLGWWMLIPPVVAGVGWRVCTTRIAGAKRPEYVALAGLITMVLAGAAAIVLAGPVSVFALPLGALVVFGGCAGFNRAGAAVIALVAVVATLTAGLVIDASTVASTPFVIVFPLTLIAAYALLGEATGRLAREHRASAITDALTGSLNRAALDARIPQLVQHAATSGAPTTIAVVDVDHLGRLNGEHGRQVGDHLLSQVSARLRGTLRAFDSVYRVDRKTFVVVLTDTAATDARTIAERARLAVGRTPMDDIAVTVSIGVATAPAGEPLDYDRVFFTASTRLAAAKAAGRNCTVDADERPESSLRLMAA